MCVYMDECIEAVAACGQIDTSDLEEAPPCFIKEEVDVIEDIERSFGDNEIDPDMGAH